MVALRSELRDSDIPCLHAYAPQERVCKCDVRCAITQLCVYLDIEPGWLGHHRGPRENVQRLHAFSSANVWLELIAMLMHMS